MSQKTILAFDKEAINAVKFLNSKLHYELKMFDGDFNLKKQGIIQFQIDTSFSMSERESYSISIKSDFILIKAISEYGFFYAAQTLLQLIPDQLDLSKNSTAEINIRCGYILDKPKYSWRSFMLDSGRQFQSPTFIKRYLDYLAMLKINMFHWHLTEGQGWRIQIKKYPKLTEVGSRVANGFEQQGFYSQNDIKEVVEYANKLSITVVPEIDIPGHSEAALIAYPEYSCSKKAPESVMGFSSNLFCGGNEATYNFLQDVLDEVCELFPGDYIHLGGDEAPKDVWDTCSVCQNKIKQEGLKNSHELQIYYSARLANYLKTKGKKVILWEDVIEQDGPKLSDNVIIYWWNYRKKKNLAFENAIKNNYKVICGTNYYTYLNFPVTPWSKYNEDRTFDLRDVYEANPSNIEKPPKQVIGMGACLWTDWNVKMSMIDQRVFPRILAIAEQMWSQTNKTSFDEFYERIKNFYPRLEALGIKYGPALKEEVPLNYKWD